MKNIFVGGLLATLLCTSTTSFGQDAFSEAKIVSQKLSGSVHMLVGMGGNIAVSAGEDGILIIDDQFEPLAEKIAAAIGDIATTPMRYVINTHYHGDHTGSNAYFREVQNSTIFAHENVRKRLASDSEHKHSALPVVTYADGITFHFNDETIKVMHFAKGHTDGDSAVFFVQANVLHAGDLFFESRFPYIDLEGGGSIDGYLKNVQSLIDMVDLDTKIIPGHGKLANQQDFIKLHSMIVETASDIAKRKQQGKSLETVLAEGLDDKWKSWSWNFITEERWITTLYKGQ